MSDTPTIPAPPGDEPRGLPNPDAADVDAEAEAIAIARGRRVRRADRVAPLPPEVRAAMDDGDTLLRAIRRWRGLSLSEVATRAGISEGHLRAVEAGWMPASRKTIKALSRILRIA